MDLFLSDGRLNSAVLDTSGSQVMELSAAEAKACGLFEINTAHVFIALTQVTEGVTARGLMAQSISPQALRDQLRSLLKHSTPLPHPPVLNRKTLSPNVQEMLGSGADRAAQRGTSSLIGEPDLLYGFLLLENSSTRSLLAQADVKWDAMLSMLGVTDPHQLEKIHEINRKSGAPSSQAGKETLMESLGRDLTKAAAEGSLQPIIGRDDEIARIVRTLARQRKNNPLLIGDAGVGKSAIVEGLAQLIAAGKVPKHLRNKRVIELPVSSLVAGTQYRGQFEERLLQLIQEAKNSDAILFFDEIHTLVGAGQGSSGMLDAANILKPALARGELHCIGATTPNEYARSIEKDEALDRRFQPIYVLEPSPEVAIEIMKGVKLSLEAYFKVEIPLEVLEAAVQLTVKYLPERHLPDKSIDLLEEACVRATVSMSSSASASGDSSLSEPVKVTLESLSEVLSAWTGVPMANFTEADGDKLLSLEKRLARSIVGQAEAIQAVSEELRIGLAGLRPTGRPLGIMLFIGPSGVGKTALAYALNEEAFGDKSSFLRLDMSEFMEQHSVAKLIGAPPGYVGYEGEGMLTGHLRQHPYGIVLLDEIEKAHPAVFDLLLQLFDAGQLRDSQNRTSDGTSTLFLMTSNIGSSYQRKPAMGLVHAPIEAEEANRDRLGQINSELTKAFRVEFLNRIDKIVYFNSLTPEAMRAITLLELEKVAQRAAKRGLEITYEDSAVDLVTNAGFSPKYGARYLQRAVDSAINRPLSELIVRGAKGKYVCSASGESLAFTAVPDHQ